MKYKSMFSCILMLGLIIITGCSNTTQGEAEQVATNFTTQFYNLESEESKDTIESIDKIQSSHDKFKTIMTEEALNLLWENRMYARNIYYCANKGCSIKIKEVDLNKRFYDEKENKIGFDYSAVIEIIYDNDEIKEVKEEGYVGLINEDNEWKVYSNEITRYSKVLMDED
ncbi:hypothetical protein [Clostridium sp. DL1XJH146]